MELNADQLIENAIRDGIREGVKQKLSSSYSNPLDKLIEASLADHAGEIRKLLGGILSDCVGDAKFRDDLRMSLRGQLAKTLVSRFGGELEKQVNVLKSDPATRARITLAIEEIVKQKSETPQPVGV